MHGFFFIEFDGAFFRRYAAEIPTVPVGSSVQIFGLDEAFKVLGYAVLIRENENVLLCELESMCHFELDDCPKDDDSETFGACLIRTGWQMQSPWDRSNVGAQSANVVVAVGKPFPFSDTRVPARFSNAMRASENAENPLRTFEDLIRFGRRNMLQWRIRNVAEKTLSAIDPIFDENGYGPEWRNS